MEIIHIVLGKANPNRMNGVNKVVNQLLSEQVKHGINAKLWGISDSLEHDYPKRDYETELFKQSRNPFKIDPKLKEALLYHKDCCFHLHGGWIPVFASIARFLKKHDIKYVITPHGAYNEVAMKRSKWVKKMYFQLFEKYVVKHSNWVHSIGQSESDSLKKLESTANSMLIPYGFKFNQPKTGISKSHRFVIGYVGRIDIHTKGLDILLEAFKNLEAKISWAELWIIGDGNALGELQNKADELKLKNIVFYGAKYGEQKDSLYQQMHVFAHPSRNEGLPSAVLEAASFGLPCVVSKETNVGNYITKYHAGFCLNENNPKNLEKALLKCYQSTEDNAWQNMSAGAQNMLSDAFSWSNLLPQYQHLYA